MVSLISLWLPILLSAVIVFIASSVIHMFLTYHQSDFDKVANEPAVMDALRPFNIPPGDYIFPRAASSKDMQTAEFQEKAKSGPVAFMTVMPNGMPAMGAQLVQWFAYCVVVGFFAAYLASRTLDADDSYLTVFQVVGCVSFLGYAGALAQNAIWFKRKWSATLKSMFDGLIYAALTAGTFGWLWP